jgi:hypothetical protein
MPNKILAALAGAALLSGAMLSGPAIAIISAPPLATNETGLVQKAHYYGHSYRHYGYYRPYYQYYGPYYGRWGFYPRYWYRGWWW